MTLNTFGDKLMFKYGDDHSKKLLNTFFATAI